MNWEMTLFYWTGWLAWEAVLFCIIVCSSIFVYERIVSYWAFRKRDYTRFWKALQRVDAEMKVNEEIEKDEGKIK